MVEPKAPAVVEDPRGVQQEYVAESVPEVAAREVEAVEREVEAVEVETESARQERPVVEIGQVAGSSTAEHINQVLSRLELLNLELKLHLDNIDSRVSRLEPHIEELASQVVKSLGLAGTAVPIPKEVPEVAPTVEPRVESEEIAAPITAPVVEPRLKNEEIAPPVVESRWEDQEIPAPLDESLWGSQKIPLPVAESLWEPRVPKAPGG